VARNIKLQLREARAEVIEASKSLLAPSPESLDECALRLQEATKTVAQCACRLGKEEGALDEARQLKREVQRTRILLNAAMEFYSQWNRRLGAMTGGYTPAGEPATPNHGCRLLGQG
jgi:hypothetical protein